MSEQSDAARFVAKLLAARSTPLAEVPQVIAGVRRALSTLGDGGQGAPARDAPQPRRRAPQRREKAAAPQQTAAAVEPEAKAAAPTLVRRSAVAAPTPTDSAAALAPPANSGVVRGVVQWFDSRTGQGALRLPGLSRDLAVDATMLAGFGIARLFKGQEVEAELDGLGDQPKLLLLRSANAAPNSPVVGGTVHDRHAKAVVVELKHQAPRRNAARAEAEQLLSARRAPK